MSNTRNTAKKATPASITTTSHNLDKAKIRVVNLIDAARQVFIKADESDDKKIIPDLKRINEHVYLYTPTIEGNTYRVFGVRHDRQEKIKFAELRQQIANELELKDVDGSVQIIGDSACFSHAGTAFARKELHEELDKNKKSIFYYGFTGNVNKDEDLTDANQLVSEYLDDKAHGAERAQRFIANVVDQHTITAIKEWKCSISENISNLMLVYSNGDKPSIKFGGDIGLDPLTTKKGICLDGGVQSLLQIFNILENDVEIQGVCQLRNPERKNFLSACHFISSLQKSIADLSAATEPTEKDISRLVNLYLQKYQPFDQKKGDAATKPALWDAAMKKLFEKQLWKKFNLFSFKNAPQVIEDQQLKKKSSYLTRTSLSNFASVGLFAFGVTVLKSVFSSSPSVDTFKTKPGL